MEETDMATDAEKINENESELESDIGDIIAPFPTNEELKDAKENLVTEGGGFLRGFQKFIERGPVVELAIGGLAAVFFKKLVDSLTDDILLPPLDLATGQVGLGDLFAVLKPGKSGNQTYSSLEDAKADGALTENYGAFLQNVLSFFISMLSLYALLTLVQRLLDRGDGEGGPKHKSCPYCKEEILTAAVRCRFCTSFLYVENEPLRDQPEFFKKSSPTIANPVSQ